MRYGNQEPTFSVVGDYAQSEGAYACEVFRKYGAEFYPCQEYEMELFLARDENGRVASRSIGISKPRQNGKSYAARWYALWMAAVKGAHVLFTAHRGDTIRDDVFKKFLEILEIPDFRNELVPGHGIYRAQGHEAITFNNGGEIRLLTRTKAGGRGGTFDVVIFDEAQELTEEERDAITPTTIASDSGDPQKIYLGTPPNAKCLGTVFRDLHDRAHDGTYGSAWWIEWAATEIGDPQNIDRWYECNPAMGYRIREDVMADAAATTRADSFAREYLAWWSPRVSALPGAINEVDWEKCATSTPPHEGVKSYAVKFSPDGKYAALAVCLRAEVEAPHVEIVEFKTVARSVKWVAEWLAPRSDDAARIVIDGRAKVDALERRLLDANVSKRVICKTSSTDIIAACAMFADAVEGEQITHWDDDKQALLDDSVTTCPRRAIGKAGGWAFADAPDGTPSIVAEAAALAYWGAMTTKRDPRRKLRIG